jgi:hypothetical protein
MEQLSYPISRGAIMDSPLPVTVTPLDDTGALLMKWPHIIDKGSITQAFRVIMSALVKANTPIEVVVDLRDDPRFLMSETITGAYKSFRHPNLGAWLVVGANPRAKMIGQALTTMTQRDNIQWFDTIAEMETYRTEHAMAAPLSS